MARPPQGQQPTRTRITQAAKAAHAAYHALEKETAWQTTQPRPARPLKPTFGPQPPGNIDHIDLDYQLTTDLYTLCTQLRTLIDPTTHLTKTGTHLTTWITTQAHHLAKLPSAQALIDLLHTHTHTINQHLHQTPTPPTPPNPWHNTTNTILRLNHLGIHITPAQLHTWAHRGHITHTKKGTTTYYNLNTVLDYLKRRGQLPHN